MPEPPRPSLMKLRSSQPVTTRLMALREAARVAAERTLIGALVVDYTNDELRFLSESYLTVAEVLTLRRLGLLQPNEGFDG